MNTDIETEQTPTVEEESTAVKETAENVVQPPETVEVKLLRYNNGMENWHGETQMLFCPQFENGRNVLPLYSKDVEFTITITDRYDKTKTIKLHPSSIFGEGVARGLAIIRFQPCVEEGENFWVPERGQSYWMAFTAIGTDGKLYISNECEMFLQHEPVLHGRLFNTGEPAPANMGGVQTQAANAVSMSMIDDLEERIGDLESQLEDVSDEVEEIVSDKIEALKEDLQKRLDQAISKLQRGKPAKIEGKSDELTLASVLEKIERLEERFSEQINAAMSELGDADADGQETIDNIIYHLSDQHEKTLEIYRDLAKKLSESQIKSPREKYVEEQTAYIKTLPPFEQLRMFTALWSTVLHDLRVDETAAQKPDDETGEMGDMGEMGEMGDMGEMGEIGEIGEE